MGGRALLLLLLGLPLASAQAQEASNPPACEPVEVDTVRFGTEPVFALCEVDRAATLRRAPRPVGATFPDGVRCMIAEFEFVVNAGGTPVIATARLLSATTPEFGAAVSRTIERWQYAPAQRQGGPVRQVVVGRFALQDQRRPFVVQQPGEPPPRPAPEARCQ